MPVEGVAAEDGQRARTVHDGAHLAVADRCAEVRGEVAGRPGAVGGLVGDPQVPVGGIGGHRAHRPVRLDERGRCAARGGLGARLAAQVGRRPTAGHRTVGDLEVPGSRVAGEGDVVAVGADHRSAVAERRRRLGGRRGGLPGDGVDDPLGVGGLGLVAVGEGRALDALAHRADLLALPGVARVEPDHLVEEGPGRPGGVEAVRGAAPAGELLEQADTGVVQHVGVVLQRRLDDGRRDGDHGGPVGHAPRTDGVDDRPCAGDPVGVHRVAEAAGQDPVQGRRRGGVGGGHGSAGHIGHGGEGRGDTGAHRGGHGRCHEQGGERTAAVPGQGGLLGRGRREHGRRWVPGPELPVSYGPGGGTGRAVVRAGACRGGRVGRGPGCPPGRSCRWSPRAAGRQAGQVEVPGGRVAAVEGEGADGREQQP